MKSEKLVLRANGKPCEVLHWMKEEWSEPKLQSGQVLVRLLAAPINPADLNLIEGTYGSRLELPATAGTEGCGLVEASQCASFQAGDLVIFLRRAATWASHAITAGEYLFKLPGRIDVLQAAMLKVNPATAWQLLHGFSTLEKNSWIVQNGGNSAVGRCVIQLARHQGIRTISFVRRQDVIEDLLALGGDHVFLDDDAGQASALEVLTGPTARLAFNAVGGASALSLMRLLQEGGIHITYGAMARKPLTVPNGLLIFRDLQIRGLWISRWIEHAPVVDVLEIYTQLANLAAAGKLVQRVDSCFQLCCFKAALERLEAPKRSGKVLFTL